MGMGMSRKRTRLLGVSLLLLSIAACRAVTPEAPQATFMCDAVDSTGAAWDQLGSTREQASAAAVSTCRQNSPAPTTCVVSMCGTVD
jgi:hypothetical protein